MTSLRTRNQGLTIIEVLLSITLSAVIMTAAAQALSIGLGYDSKIRSSGEIELKRKAFEDRVVRFLSRAYLNPISTDEGSFFIASQGPLSGGESSENSDTLTFTVAGNSIPSAAREGTDLEFEQLNEQVGPVGGITEVCISPNAIGAAPSSTGTFLRIQTPADGDATQGGRESQLAPEATVKSLEFYDGEAWQTTWDTRTQSTKRLPASIRFTYEWDGDGIDRVVTVGVVSSDVTPDNPVIAGEGQ
jgi:hypothetical protein